jgi:iron complex transport system substrate-binding protein
MSKQTTFALVLAAICGIGISVLISYSRTDANVVGHVSPASERKSPQRIICMSPSVTELTFALGQGDRVVGVSQHTVHPPEALDRPRCGGFVNPNFERIMALQPDLVLTQGLAKEVRRFAEEQDINCLTLNITELNSIFSAIQRMGRALHCPEKAAELTRTLQGQLNEVRSRVSDRDPVPTFVVIGREPGSLGNLTTIGPGSYLADVLELAGGRNIFGDLSQRYATVNKESLAQRRPQMIVELHGDGMMGTQKKQQVRRTWGQMSALPAVQQGRVQVVDGTYALIPGPRVIKLARDLASHLHPQPTP